MLHFALPSHCPTSCSACDSWVALHRGSHRAGRYSSSTPRSPKPSLFDWTTHKCLVCVRHAVSKAPDRFMQHKLTHIGLWVNDKILLALTLTNVQLLIKKTQGSAWFSVKKDFILLSENWGLRFPQRDIRFRTEAENGQMKAQILHWHLNIQITNEHKDMYSVTVRAPKKHEIIIILIMNKIRVLLYGFRDKSRQTKTQKQYLLNNLLVYKCALAKKKRKRKGNR